MDIIIKRIKSTSTRDVLDCFKNFIQESRQHRHILHTQDLLILKNIRRNPDIITRLHVNRHILLFWIFDIFIFYVSIIILLLYFVYTIMYISFIIELKIFSFVLFLRLKDLVG